MIMFMGRDISMMKTMYKNKAAITIMVKNRLEFRGSKGAQAAINTAAYSSDAVNMVRTAKLRGSVMPPDTGMS